MTTAFDARYRQLNAAQRQAVDAIDGPLLVVAGPGTGKTELLGMRAANILRSTDTLPENILCLTFTDSGAAAMRERLAGIIGPDAYRVAIHTFHSFGTEVINQNNQYFYHGAAFRPADEVTMHQVLSEIFDELDYTNPLASKNNGEHTHLKDTMSTISELKRAGLSSDELLAIINANEEVLDSIERDLTEIFSNKPSTTMLSLLVPLAERVAALAVPTLPSGITPLANVLALSMAHAFDEAVATNKTTPITAWRNQWLEKNTEGEFVFKDRKRHAKLRSVAHIYYVYLSRMEQAGLYDYDDMILGVVHGMETQPDLKYNLQEKYHYIMVDEFQDTNLAQLRILFDLTDTSANEGNPNVMAVGDDDQAIYSFQGADVNNIHRFRNQYPSHQSIVLTENYRSGAAILQHAREVIVQGTGRLETTMEISKQLEAQKKSESTVILQQLPSVIEERAWIAQSIKERIKNGATPASIAVLARRHQDLVSLLPYLYHEDIAVNYERRDNVLDIEAVRALELLARITVSLHDSEFDVVDSLMPQLLGHPMCKPNPEAIWRLGLTCYRDRITWLEAMQNSERYQPLAQWLISLSANLSHTTLEASIDILTGIPTEEESSSHDYSSPLFAYYFSDERLKDNPDAYLTMLEALRTLRHALRQYRPDQDLTLQDFLSFIELHRQMKTPLVSLRRPSEHAQDAITLLSAHKAKGLEFDTVFIVSAIDSIWGERVRSRTRLIGYPENLPLAPAGNTYDERLRLFFVAMTRACRTLIISYSHHDEQERDSLIARFLVGSSLTPTVSVPQTTLAQLTDHAELAWHDTITKHPSITMKQLLTPQLEAYKLSSTHLNAFIDITRGGPQAFLLHNLLRFPQAKSAAACYGTAIHAVLQRAHTHLAATGDRRPVEDILGDFVTELQNQRLPAAEFALYSKKGVDSLTRFLDAKYSTFTATQKTELNFSTQHVQLGDARLTGSLDLVDIADNSIVVTDYKTGKPSRTWNGNSEYQKIKLHKYKQQLMFYELLVSKSRDYSKYAFTKGVLQFVEPDQSGAIHDLSLTFTEEELAEFSDLIAAVWHCITTLELPDTSSFEPTLKGIIEFEHYLIDNFAKKY
ncbi:ATP-dependent helicase [Candidatus Saccharibacteria bacterium]|nr:MAG: ATP-dependent helicase [Candidatus Saccharibacteria bacterium]